MSLPLNHPIHSSPLSLFLNLISYSFSNIFPIIISFLRTSVCLPLALCIITHSCSFLPPLPLSLFPFSLSTILGQPLMPRSQQDAWRVTVKLRKNNAAFIAPYPLSPRFVALLKYKRSKSVNVVQQISAFFFNYFCQLPTCLYGVSIWVLFVLLHFTPLWWSS